MIILKEYKANLASLKEKRQSNEDKAEELRIEIGYLRQLCDDVCAEENAKCLESVFGKNFVLKKNNMLIKNLILNRKQRVGEDLLVQLQKAENEYQVNMDEFKKKEDHSLV